ncbi:related to lipase/esterase [Cephalotrichum gorgonifer]|uniref:Related to lipase/esterase n=1 Tax=Cephalotrichum gorgonifer TaxID=2041049 RepID=A0AAE8MXS0_9PEZI|nr:related to lipase/esterase [Cephalotrichum gorgonifer]
MCDFSRYGGPSDEWLAIEATLPPTSNDPALLGSPELRKKLNAGREAISATAFKDLRPKLHVKDYSIPTRDGESIEARTYQTLEPADSNADLPAVYIHFHGGGYHLGTLSSEDAICGRIALGANVIVLNVNYRHTPEYKYPVPWNDAEDAFEWAHAHIRDIGGNPLKVVVGGISAGAHFTASLTLQKHLGKVATSCPPIAGQVLMIPCLVAMDCYGPQLAKMADPSVSSMVENANAPILPVDRCRWFSNMLEVKDPEGEGVRLSPGNASPEQVKGLPPTVFGITGLDPLRDEGLLYAKILTEAGVPTDIHLFKGVPHGFRRFGQLSEAARWDRVLVDGIKWALSNPAASYEFTVKTE